MSFIIPLPDYDKIAVHLQMNLQIANPRDTDAAGIVGQHRQVTLKHADLNVIWRLWSAAQGNFAQGPQIKSHQP